METRVKICGITSYQDGIDAVNAGADAIGLVFYEKSPRNVSIEGAKEIISDLPAFVSVVALVMNADESFVSSICREVKPNLLQFHGNESRQFCNSFDMPYIKAIQADHNLGMKKSVLAYPDARGFLLDAHAGDKPGGSGDVFDWELVDKERKAKPDMTSDDVPLSTYFYKHKLIVAGGLNPSNVQSAVAKMRPYAVDVSSGVESAPGIKDRAKMKAFVEAAKGN